MNTIKVFSKRLVIYRKSKGMTAQALADYLNVTEPAIACYVKGRNLPTVQNLVKLADLFDVSLDYLVGRTDVPEINKKVRDQWSQS
jgi:transcriptional regulator with XRE-family HTH domain